MAKSAESRISSYLKKNLSKKRRRHTRAVAEFAQELAGRHGWKEEDAYLAGLAHDAAKEWPPGRLISFIKQWNIRVPSFAFIRKNSPNLLHAYAGAGLARMKKWVTTRAAENAIAAHTLGAWPMTLPQKILYVADYASPDRRYPGVRKIRALARRNIDRAFAFAFKDKMNYTISHKKPVHPITKKILNALIRKKMKSDQRP